jgi:hypothetical protein
MPAGVKRKILPKEGKKMKKSGFVLGIIGMALVMGFFLVGCVSSGSYLKYSPDLTEENASILSITHINKYSDTVTRLEVTAINGEKVSWPKRNLKALIPEGLNDITFLMSYSDRSSTFSSEVTLAIPMRRGVETSVSCEGDTIVQLGGSSLRTIGRYFNLTFNGVKYRFQTMNDGRITHFFDADSPTGTFILNNIPEKYNGKYARLTFVYVSDDVKTVYGFMGGAIEMSDGVNFVRLARIASGSLRLPLFDLSYLSGGSIVRYTGNDSGELIVDIYDESVLTFSEIDDDVRGIAQIHFNTITFSNGNVTVSANDGNVID